MHHFPSIFSQRKLFRWVPSFIPMSQRAESPLTSYGFANSIDSLLHASKSRALLHYDKLLRTDSDTFLTPAFATWNPSGLIVGHGEYCFENYLTCHRLRRVAIDMGLPSTGENGSTVDNVGSTWYGDTAMVLNTTRSAMKAMIYLDRYEFTPLEKSRDFGIKGWPAWHHGVLTMYAGQIAVNACGKGNIVKDSESLDFLSSSKEDIMKKHGHLHTWQNNDRFSKFAFSDGDYNNVSLSDLDTTIARDYAMYMALDANR